MGDPGFVSGFIGVGIQIAIGRILHYISIAVRCSKELSALKDVVLRIGPLISQIQQYRLEINRKRGIPTSQIDNSVSSVNAWLKTLDALLFQASQMAQQCTISSFNIVSRHQTSIKIANLKSNIDKHLESVHLLQVALTHEVLLGQFTQRESVQASATSSASTSMQAIHPTQGFFIEEPLILGQEEAFARLEKFVVEAEGEGNPLFRIGVLGKGGAGKTLLLRRVFNSEKVRDVFTDDLLLWLTVSNDPSFTNLMKELCLQMATLTKIDFDRNMSEERVKIWLHERLQTQRFALFLDDVWREGAQLMRELGLLRLIHRSNSRIIVSSRDRGVLSKMGIAETSTIRMGDLMEEDSWHLFANHAFPYNNGNLPANIDEKTAKVVCASCGGLPLAIKVIGSSMATTTHPKEWEMAGQRFPVSDSHDKKSSHDLYDRLRLSYDALGNYDVNLQLCFLFAAAAFPEDKIVQVDSVMIPLWIGEGLLAGKKMAAGYDPFDMGRIYVDQLADRCLIEPMMRDIHGTVIWFRIHDVLRNLGIQIAEREESFCCQVGKGLTALNESECQGRTRILLNSNKLSSLPESLRGPEICSLLMMGNRGFAKIPKRVIGSMISLKTLDLSWTSISSLPNSVGGLKQLVCLRLRGVRIRRLPPSLVNLVNLEILDLYESSIMELPSSLHKLRSLRYLSLGSCKALQYLPRNISRLTSLQSLDMYKCSRLWTKVEAKKKRCKKVASINNLGSLRNLKRLILHNNGETVEEGTLGNMAQMETLQLTLTGMASLPPDMGNMAKLKTFQLKCYDVIKIGRNFFEFQNLTYLRLVACLQLEELPDLHKLRSLRELWIFNCPKIRKFPEEFGETAGFPSLETFSLVHLDELEVLPFVQEGAMPSLKIISIRNCEVLQMLPQSYLNIKTLQKIRVFGCSKVVEDLERVKIEKTKIEMITMSTIDTLKLRDIYLDVKERERVGFIVNFGVMNSSFS